MARDENPPFERGGTLTEGAAINADDLGGLNLEGKEYVFENTANIGTTLKPTGRPVRVKVVRNVSGVALKPGRVATFSSATTAQYECRVGGYAVAIGDRPAGIVDEFLPAAGVPNNELFFIVVGGPSKLAQGATTAAAVTPGTRIVPTAYGATAGDDLGGRLGVQDLTGATAPLANNIQNCFAVAATTMAGGTTNAGILAEVVVNLR